MGSYRPGPCPTTLVCVWRGVCLTFLPAFSPRGGPWGPAPLPPPDSLATMSVVMPALRTRTPVWGAVSPTLPPTLQVHERHSSTDLLLGLLRRLLPRRPSLRLVLMSATLDEDALSAFFGGAPVLHVPGRTHPIDVRHVTSDTSRTRPGGDTSETRPSGAVRDVGRRRAERARRAAGRGGGMRGGGRGRRRPAAGRTAPDAVNSVSSHL